MTVATSLANGDSLPYWEGAAQGKLLFQKCRHCASIQFPPRYHCATCWEVDFDCTESSGKGSIESFTIIRRSPLPAFRDEVPYVVASVILAEGPRMIASLVGGGALEVKIGDMVAVDYQEDNAGRTLPVFRRI